MKAYTNSIPGTVVTYSLVPIPGGEFLMGSPEGEKGRTNNEGPQHKVKISPFWMGRTEVTWNEYELFMYPDQERALTLDTNNPYLDKASDAVSRPTKP
jgi:formylglycine-generating enzyme required for sulfatase activity